MTGTEQTTTQPANSSRGLGRLLGSTAVAITGYGMLTSASPLLAASLTRNPVAVSAVAAAGYAAWLFFGLIAGALTDRWPRRRVMVTADLSRALVLALLAALIATNLANVAILIVCVFLVGVGNCFFDPAAQAAIPAVVGRDKDALSRANGKIWAIDTFGRSLAGPPIGATVFAVAAVVPFALDAIAFAASALILSGLTNVGRATPTSEVMPLPRAIRAGITFLVRHRDLRALTMAMATYNFGYNIAFATLVLFAQQHLGLDAVGFGLLVATMALGGIAGGWVAPRLPARISALHVYAIALATQAGAWAIVATAASPWIAGAALVLAGVASTTVSVVGGSARQLLTPDDMLGRVVSVTRLLGIGSAAIGSMVGGGLAATGGLLTPFFGAAAVLLASAALYGVIARSAQQ